MWGLGYVARPNPSVPHSVPRVLKPSNVKTSGCKPQVHSLKHTLPNTT